MNKVYGLTSSFSPVRFDRTRCIISYGLEAVDETHATWFEVYYYKKQVPRLKFQQVKDVIISEINAQTDERILSGFVWNDMPVWLSSENQFNFKAAYDLAAQTAGASLPVKFKLGEEEDETPVYYTFETMEVFTDFYTRAIAYINQCLNEGWQRKDSIDWNDYKEFFSEEELVEA